MVTRSELTVDMGVSVIYNTLQCISEPYSKMRLTPFFFSSLYKYVSTTHAMNLKLSVLWGKNPHNNEHRSPRCALI